MTGRKLSDAEMLVAVAAIQAREGVRDDRSRENDDAEGPEPRYVSPRESDWLAGKDEDRTKRQWP